MSVLECLRPAGYDPPSGEWDDEKRRKLPILWAQGHSTKEIAFRLGLGKNQVIGAIHRSGLPGRPSPIYRDGQRTAPKPYVRRTPVVTLPSLASLAATVVSAAPARVPSAPALVVTGGVAMPAYAPLPPSPRPAPQRAQEVPAEVGPRPYTEANRRDCQWPLNDGVPWLFCDAAAVSGKPYCLRHCLLSWPRPRVAA